MKPVVSIIIPAYNAEAFIEQTIVSALNQTFPYKEIVVVDDGSSDATYSIAKSFAGSSVRVVTQTNRGAGAARNRGLDESQGDYVQYLDADDLLDPKKIEAQMQMVDKFGREFLYAGRWKLFYDDINKGNFSANDLWRDFDDPGHWLVTAWTKQIWMHPSAWLTPRSLIDLAGPWNEGLSLHDDGEFFCRVLLKSQGVKFCDESKSYYRKGIPDSLSSHISEKAILSHFTICQLYEKHLMSLRNNEISRKACASNYLAFHYAHFPGSTALREKAKAAALRLGGSDIVPQGTALFQVLKKVAGWKLARRIEKFYYENGLNRASMLNRAKNLIK
ncbi:MAG TPA: glycosyltransferase family 2 protein [Chryseolinea sp.]|nr:glycosyltransferase family 2 protein [Chryseolinea sp.]